MAAHSTACRKRIEKAMGADVEANKSLSRRDERFSRERAKEVEVERTLPDPVESEDEEDEIEA